MEKSQEQLLHPMLVQPWNSFPSCTVNIAMNYDMTREWLQVSRDQNILDHSSMLAFLLKHYKYIKSSNLSDTPLCSTYHATPSCPTCHATPSCLTCHANLSCPTCHATMTVYCSNCFFLVPSQHPDNSHKPFPEIYTSTASKSPKIDNHTASVPVSSDLSPTTIALSNQTTELLETGDDDSYDGLAVSCTRARSASQRIVRSNRKDVETAPGQPREQLLEAFSTEKVKLRKPAQSDSNKLCIFNGKTEDMNSEKPSAKSLEKREISGRKRKDRKLKKQNRKQLQTEQRSKGLWLGPTKCTQFVFETEQNCIVYSEKNRINESSLHKSKISSLGKKTPKEEKCDTAEINSLDLQPEGCARSILKTYQKANVLNSEIQQNVNNSDDVYLTDSSNRVVQMFDSGHIDLAQQQSTNTTELLCTHCSVICLSQSDLEYHLRKCHREFPCQYCGKVLRSTYTLREHIRSHTGDRPYKCDVDSCAATFSLSSTYKAHMRQHRGENRYLCPHCGKSFVRSSNLSVHIRVCTGLKPYKCSTCNKAFSDAGYYKTHVNNHLGIRPYKCEYCGKEFAQSTNLRLHIRTHTLEKPYACAQCPLTFAIPSSLKEHLKTHSGQKPFKCGVCGKAFARSCNRLAHMRTHDKK